jgi:hypothetical protein
VTSAVWFTVEKCRHKTYGMGADLFTRCDSCGALVLVTKDKHKVRRCAMCRGVGFVYLKGVNRYSYTSFIRCHLHEGIA